MTAYRFKTEEEMIASYGPNWRSIQPIKFPSILDQALGMPISLQLYHDLQENSVWGKGKYESRFTSQENCAVLTKQWKDKTGTQMFDIKDTVLANSLKDSWLQATTHTPLGGSPIKVMCTIALDWIVSYHIDAEGVAKMSYNKKREKENIVIKIPQISST